MSDDLITVSLEAVGDPTAEVYARLFAQFPDVEERFRRDTTGAIKAEMLTMVFDCLMNPAGPYQANVVRTERVNHDSSGAASEIFDRFFWIVRDACRERAGEAWTPATEAAWTAQIERILAASR
ncbi:globin [Phenylobacterium sp.]|uniref:globin n=1 Tax=Phenylobacterium sp. TaxID=1871053 RepID=UPI0025F4859B|nr:globin [Phenylobacterium sp.]